MQWRVFRPLGADSRFNCAPHGSRPCGHRTISEYLHSLRQPGNTASQDQMGIWRCNFRTQSCNFRGWFRIEKAVIERYKLDSTTQENYLRRFFRENWHYLRLATQQVTKRKKLRSNVVPYLITVRLFAKYGKPRTAEDVVVAELETLTD